MGRKKRGVWRASGQESGMSLTLYTLLQIQLLVDYSIIKHGNTVNTAEGEKKLRGEYQ